MEDSSLSILDISHRIDKGEKRTIKVLGKKFKISDLSRYVVNKITDIQFRVKFYEDDKDNLKSRRARLKFLGDADAMTASYILLNKWSYIPFLHSLHWRYISRKYNSEHFSAIIKEGLDNDEYAFFLKNSIVGQNTLATRLQMMKGL